MASKPSLLLIGFLVSFAYSNSSFTCQQKADNACIAECVDGGETITLDISKIVSYPQHVSVDSSFPDVGTVRSFVFSCRGETSSCGTSAADNQPTSVCMTDTNSKQYSCGSAENSDWQLIQTKPMYLFTIRYKGGYCLGTSCKNSMFTFTQTSENDVSIDFIRSNMEGGFEVYHFGVSGPCVGQANCTPPSLTSTGSITAGIVGLSIISVAIVGVIAYFVIGSAIMYFGRGARGKEVIPNVTFWMSLPGLIWGGCKFITSPVVNWKSNYYSSL